MGRNIKKTLVYLGSLEVINRFLILRNVHSVLLLQKLFIHVKFTHIDLSELLLWSQLRVLRLSGFYAGCASHFEDTADTLIFLLSPWRSVDDCCHSKIINTLFDTIEH